ncbi:MAG: NAD-dependent epimerase/dehydratase family protein [Bacteroidetes bacterium]|nr:NAD-dependent epimerase/dehydratase family protein [Bacteroidota bacterium]
MKNILVIGSFGQIGSELTPELRKRYGHSNVVAADLCIKKDNPFLSDGPVEKLDITDPQAIADLVKKYKIDTIFNMAAILSAVGEKKPQLAWNVGVNGIFNCLEVARELNCALFTPSSIAAFGEGTPLNHTPQDTIQRPGTMYGVTKVTGELLSDYYHKRFGVDSRSVRFPGIISNVTMPGGGTTDYAVEIYYEAIKKGHYTCFLSRRTFLDMMYMPDALNASIQIMNADPSRLVHRNAFNIASMSLEPEMLATEIRKHIPDFTMDYAIDEVKQGIADSWPNSMDDSCARKEWDWKPEWNLTSMTEDMLKAIRQKQADGLI